MIYIVRHGESISQKEHLCIGRTDIPLSESGIRQIRLLGAWFSRQIKNNAVHVGTQIYTSPLLRCRESAGLLEQEIAESAGHPMEIVPCERLQEISMGVWDGLSFRKIREIYPEEYEDRGHNIGEFRMEGSETYREAGERFLSEIERLVRSSKDKDLIVIAHAGVIRASICLIEKREMKEVSSLMEIRQPNAGITQLSCHEENGSLKFRVERIGFRPVQLLDEREIKRLYEKYQVPDHIVSHMKAVAQVQEKILQRIDPAEEMFDHEVLKKAGLLHDLVRLHRDHAQKGAQVLEKEGYDEIAPLIALHHSPDIASHRAGSAQQLSAADILFFADKLVQGDHEIQMEERFKASLKKCTTAEGLYKHEQLYQRANRIKMQIGRKIN